MSKLWVGGLALGVMLVSLVMVAAQPPEGKGRGPGRNDGPPPGGPGGPPDGPPGPPRWVPGRLMPERVRDELELTDEQEKQLTDLEKEVKERLLKLLTADQKKKLDELRKRGPGGPGGPGAPPPPPPPREREAPPRPPERDEVQANPSSAGIQWYATWESGLREARRTGRPILLVSAAPHCAGVSGCW